MKRIKNFISPKSRHQSPPKKQKLDPVTGEDLWYINRVVSTSPDLPGVNGFASPPSWDETHQTRGRVPEQNTPFKKHERESVASNVNSKAHLHTLKAQLNDAQTAFQNMQAERNDLRHANLTLEKDNQDVRRELRMREQEVASLARRCQSQDEKMREATKLRSANADLAQQVEDLQASMAMRDEEILQTDNLRQELATSQEDRNDMRDRLAKLTRDHRDVVDTLNNCFQNMQRLQEKQLANDEERLRDSKRAELMLENQRLEYQESINEMKVELQSRKERIDKMEAILREKMETTTSLRRERNEIHQSMTNLRDSLGKVFLEKEEYAQKLAHLEMESQEIAKKTQLEYNETIQELHCTIDEKVTMIEKLEEEVSTYMHKHMVLAEEMDKELIRRENLERDSQRSMEKLEQSIQELEEDKWALKELLSTKEMELSVVSSNNKMLEEKQAELINQLEWTRERARELQEENAFIMDMEKQLEDVNFSIIEAHEDNDRLKDAFNDTVATLHNDFELKEMMWHELEVGLNEKVSTLEVEKRNIEEELTSRLSAAGETIASLRDDLESRKAELGSLRTTLTTTEEKAATQEEVMSNLEAQLKEERLSSTQKGERIEELINSLDQVRKESEAVVLSERQNNHRALYALQEEIEEMKNALIEKSADSVRLNAEVERLRTISQEQLTEVQFQLKEQKMLVVSLTEKLHEEQRVKIDSTTVLREEHENELKGLHDELNQAKNLLNEKCEELESLRSDLSTMANKLEQDSAAADHTMKTQDEKLGLQQQELDEKKRQLHETIAETDRLKTELESSRAQHLKETSALVERVVEKERIVSSLDAELQQERTTLEAKESALKTLRVELEEMSQQVIEKERSICALQNDMADLRAIHDSNLNHLKENVAEKEQKISRLSTELIEKGSILESVGSERDNLKDSLKMMEVELSETKTLVTTHANHIQELRTKIHDQQDETFMSQERIEELQSGLRKAMAELTTNFKTRSSLEGKISQLQDELSASQTSFKLQSEQILSLEKELNHHADLSNSTALSLEKSRSELREAREGFESDLRAALKQHSVFQQEILCLKSTLHQRNLAKEREISSLSADLESARFKFEQESKALANEITEKDDIISRKDAELATIKSSLEEGTSVLSDEVKSKTAKICSLMKSLSSLQCEMEEKERKTSSILAERDVERDMLQKELRSLREKHEETDQELLSSVRERDQSIAVLTKQIDGLRVEKEEQIHSSQKLITTLQHKLKKAEIDLAISQDELRELQVIDLKEAEETIESLETSLQSLRLKARADEAAANTLVAELQAQIDQLEARLSGAERGKNDSKSLHEKALSKIQGELEALRQENDSLNIELKEKFNKLNDRHSKITSLTQEKVDLESKMCVLTAEIDSLREECKKAKEENEKISFALQREINNQHSSRQDDDIELFQRKSALQKQLQESEVRISSLVKQLAETEGVLETRTTLLADMVAHNKAAEGKEKTTESELSELREMSEKYQVEMEETKEEMARLRATFVKKEDQLLETIQNERNLREEVEVELENAHAALRTKRDNKELIELERENGELRDKVRRQEAYLKRKLEKDKAVRERSSRPSSLEAPSLPTPSGLSLRERNIRPSGIMTPSRPSSSKRRPMSSAKRGTNSGLSPLSENNLFPGKAED